MRSYRFIALAAFLLMFTVFSLSLSEAYTDEVANKRLDDIFSESETQKPILLL